jgi:hypothetical protein
VKDEVKINAEDSSTGVINMIEEEVIRCRMSKDFWALSISRKTTDLFLFLMRCGQFYGDMEVGAGKYNDV